jgi:hypothetical protein
MSFTHLFTKEKTYETGRPFAIYERDYDTCQPNENEPDEHEQWVPILPSGQPWNSSPTSLPDPSLTSSSTPAQPRSRYPPTKSHSISCFNASGSLSVLVNRIIFSIYAIRTRVIGQSSASLLGFFDQSLANWFLKLPDHLTFNPSSKKVPPPHGKLAISFREYEIS